MQRVMRLFSLVGLMAGLLVVLAACGSGNPSPASGAGPTQPNAPSASAAQPSAPGSGPRLTLDKPVIDFGKVAYGQKVTPVWKLTNSGKAPLQIKDFQLDVKEGC